MAHIIVIGAGLGGIPAAFDLRKHLPKDHRVTLVGARPHFEFTPSNPWIAVGWRTPQETQVVMRTPLENKGIDWRVGYQDSGAGPKKSSRSRRPRRKKICSGRARSTCRERGPSRAVRNAARCCRTTDPVGQCPKCGFALHACKQCEHFDPSSRFECNQPIPARISPKDKRNDCSLYSIRVMVKKETSSKGSQRPNDARAAFDNLFKD